MKQQRWLFAVLGSARVSRLSASPARTFGVSPKRSFSGERRQLACAFRQLAEKNSPASCRRQQAGSLRSPDHCSGARAIIFVAALAIASICNAQNPSPTPAAESEPIVITATRIDIPLDQSPASVTLLRSQDFEEKQIERVADALREVPGVSVTQSGTPGQLTSVFTRGLRSEHTQVLLDGIPINQGLAGQMDFADFTIDDIDRIEVARGPQSTLYGPRALAGAIQIFTKRGEGDPVFLLSTEGGSYGTFREAFESEGQIGAFDYSLGLSRLDTDNARPNNQYRLTNALADVGWSPDATLRIGTVITYSLADTGNPNTIFDPKPLDNFLTERWLIGPHIDWQPVEWWSHHLIVSYDHERQVNDPNQDGFVGATRALFKRTQVDYQNDLRATSWLTITSGFFFSDVDTEQERPFVSQEFGPQPRFIGDHTQEIGVFAELTIKPTPQLILVSGGRFDHFNQFGDIWTWREAASYLIRNTDTTLHASVATGFSPPSSQDKIFRFNPNPSQPLPPLEPEKGLGWDAGIEQRLCNKRVTIGATYFHNDLSNLIGTTGLFETLNLGSARTQGIETELRAMPSDDLTLIATYTYLDAEKTSSADITQPKGARLPRRPRNEVYASASYLWCKKLRTTISAKWVNAREELSFGEPNFDIEDYSFVNFAAEYEINPHLSVFGRIDNITNEHYAEVFGFPALGRAVYGGAKLSF
ncbi:MAG TPA: TonB-dependent receptor [Chthoniobacterales bacterium]|nr:TonB-dependent receptor [Chthoniobacterales bacterium]